MSCELFFYILDYFVISCIYPNSYIITSSAANFNRKNHDILSFCFLGSLFSKDQESLPSSVVVVLIFTFYRNYLIMFAVSVRTMIYAISRWEAKSQICSDCGYKWGKLDLKIRSLKCLNCGTEQDCDENAAKNINKACT